MNFERVDGQRDNPIEPVSETPTVEPPSEAIRMTETAKVLEPRIDLPPVAKEQPKQQLKTTEEILATHSGLADLCGELGVQPQWYDVKILTNGPETLKYIEEAISSADKLVKIRMFSWAPDDSGQRVVDTIARRVDSKPDLLVEIEVDFLGSLFVGSFPKNMLSRLRILVPKIIPFVRGMVRHRIGLRTMYRAWKIRRNVSNYDRLKPKDRRKLSILAAELFSVDELLALNPILLQLSKMDRVNLEILANGGLDKMDHSKKILVDETRILGGRNIGNDYLGHESWDDYSLVLENTSTEPQAGANQTLCFHLYNQPGPARKSERSEKKQITYTALKLIEQAQSTIEIEHAYITSRAVIKALRRAAKRGVTITIIRSQPEAAAIEAANEEYFALLGGSRRRWWQWLRWWRRLDRQQNIEVRLSPRVSHAKVMIIDGTYILTGSFNFNRNSMYRHGENAVLLVAEEGNAATGKIQQSFKDRAAAAVPLVS